MITDCKTDLFHIFTAPNAYEYSVVFQYINHTCYKALRVLGVHVKIQGK